MNLMRFFPAFVRRRIEHRPSLVKILENIGWLVFDKVLRMGVGLVVGVWVARYLGPEQFGQLSYALAFVGLFGAIAGLGLNSIVVRDIVRDPECTGETLGTAFAMQLLGGIVALGAMSGIIAWMRPDDQLTRIMVAILGMSLVLKASEVVKYWFEAKVQSRYVVWVENGVFLVMAVIKVALILMKASLVTFVWLMLVEAGLVAVGLMTVVANKGGGTRVWKVRIERAKSLLKDSWPLILSGLAIMVYMRIDQIMLGEMLGPESVGIYTAAIRVSEVWYFIPMVIVASVVPKIIEAKKQSEELYYKRLQQLYDMIVVISLFVAIVMTFVSSRVVYLLYGGAFAQASSVLSIHIWTGVFVGLGVASGQWLLLENLQLFSFLRTLAGAIMNIGANFLLIPKYGVVGAAIGTVLSQIVASYVFDLAFIDNKKNINMKTKALLLSDYYWRR